MNSDLINFILTLQQRQKLREREREQLVTLSFANIWSSEHKIMGSN